MRCLLALLAFLLLATTAGAQPGQGNRLAYLDEVDPYYPSHKFPKLTAPMWVGDQDTEAVVILGIDDMKDPKRYEAFLRPILNRLKKIDGRAPVSIMTCAVDPKDPQLQDWLKEGLSLECHTFDHPCPFFKAGFDKAKATYDKCVDLMHEVPNSKPVAFRMPCCDSMNTPSPRFYAEIFNKTTPVVPSPDGGEGRVRGGNFLQIDTSVFNVFTSADPALPKELVLDDKGQPRFTPYLPADRSFVNTIENYPYPYVIGRLCWQFPCMTPSDWQAQHRHKPNNPQTVRDWKAALDCTVIKQGVFCMVFHPHGWIKNDQVVEFIDYAAERYGKRVKFLTFREALERLVESTSAALRNKGGDAGPATACVIDLDNDGFLDVVEHVDAAKSGRARVHRIWNAQRASWIVTAHATLAQNYFDAGFVATPDGKTAMPYYQFSAPTTKETVLKIERFAFNGFSLPSPMALCRYVERDGPAVFILENGDAFSAKKLPFKLPTTSGLRFLDLDGDGKLDIIFSNEKEYGIYLFENMEKGWSRKVMAGKRGDKDALPMISRNGTNNGFWVHSGHLWWANEDTALLKDHVDRRSIKELLVKR